MIGTFIIKLNAESVKLNSFKSTYVRLIILILNIYLSCQCCIILIVRITVLIWYGYRLYSYSIYQ